jgi:mRNA-degrading endonuclease RelE of RelBE toxin-antitoxin system
MGTYQIVIRPSAEKDLLKHKKAGDTALLKKLHQLSKI